jgi:predicted methyltransferase
MILTARCVERSKPMTRDELHDRFIREGAFPGTPKGRGLINDLVIDAEVCEQATCEGCGHKGLELVTYTDEPGDYRAAVAVCPERDEAFEF